MREIVTAVVSAVVLTLLLGFCVWLVWNPVVPAVFGLPKITYMQAVGLYVLADFLFKPITKK